MKKYKHLSLSEEFEKVIEKIKNNQGNIDEKDYKKFYNLFQKTMEELNLTQSQLIALATDKKTRTEFTFALMGVINLTTSNNNHLLHNAQVAQRAAQNIAGFAEGLNNHLSKIDTRPDQNQTKENKMERIALEELKTKDEEFLDPENGSFIVKTPSTQIEVRAFYNDGREHHDSDDAVVWTTHDDSGAAIEDLIEVCEREELDAQRANRHNYMMLSRLQADCEYFIGHGRGNPKNLFYDTVDEHIDEMKKIWNQLDAKPEWLSLEEIEEYKQEMLNIVPGKTFEEVDKYLATRAEKKASLQDIQTDPELETPEGLEQAKENLINKLSQNSNTQDYN